MRSLALLSLVCACGGSSTTTTTATTPTAAATPTATATASAEDTSPPSIGSRHKKVGNGWFLSGSGKEFYEAIYEPGANPVVLVRPSSDAHGRWVTLMKNVSSAPYVGKKIRVRIGVKSKGVTGRGEMWARAAPPHSPEDAPSTTTKVDENGDRTYDVTIDVKDDVRVIEYGVSLAGAGEVRVGRDAIDVVSQ